MKITGWTQTLSKSEIWVDPPTAEDADLYLKAYAHHISTRYTEANIAIIFGECGSLSIEWADDAGEKHIASETETIDGIIEVLDDAHIYAGVHVAEDK